MRTLLTMGCLLAAVHLASAQARSYEIRPAGAARMELRVYKTGFLRGKSHVFVFSQYRGTLLYDPQKPEAAQINLTLAAAGAKCTDTWLSAKDLKSVQEYALKDMLAAGRYPDITFASSEVVPRSGGGFEVRGTLTIRGVAKPAVVNVTVDGLTFHGDAKIRLTNYGLKPPTAALGTIGTKDDMDFSFALTLE